LEKPSLQKGPRDETKTNTDNVLLLFLIVDDEDDHVILVGGLSVLGRWVTCGFFW
jgi:hypothetical protein